MTTHDEHTDVTPSNGQFEQPRQTEEFAEEQSSDSVVETGEALTPPADSSQDQPTDVSSGSADESLFADADLAELRARWDSVQAGFVDDPSQCVKKADGLVSDVVDQLTSGFSEARSRLEEQWARGEEASTEDLRLALKRYREFFQRLLAV